MIALAEGTHCLSLHFVSSCVSQLSIMHSVAIAVSVAVALLACRESAQAQLAQLEATLAVERSEKSQLEHQLADALLAIELTHAELGKLTAEVAELKSVLGGKDDAIGAANAAAQDAENKAAVALEELKKQEVWAMSR